MAYDQLEPFGPRAMNLNAGVIASTYMNCHLKKGVKSIQPDQVMIGDSVDRKQSAASDGLVEEKQSLAEQKQTVLSIAKVFGVKKRDVTQ